MVASITQKSSNTLENQGDKSLEKGQSKDASLFDQFSEILDKIATSLNHAKQKKVTQSLSDLSASLSQAAAQHQQVAQRAPVAPRALPADASAQALESASRTARAPKSDAVKTEASTQQSDTSSKEQEDNTVAQAAPVAAAEGTQSEAAPAAQARSEEGAEEVAVKADTQVEVPVTETEGTQAEVVGAETITQVAPVAPVSDSEQVAEEIEVETAKAASAAPQTVQQQQQVPVSEQVAPEQAEQVAVEQTAVQQNSAVQQQTESSEQTEAAPVTEADSSETEHAVRISQPRNEDFINAHPDAAKAGQDKEMDMRQMLLQSAQALVSQALMLSPSKQMMEVSATQKLIMPTQAVQGLTQASANGSSIASPLLQNKLNQTISEKTRELTRPVAQRTMERVESALKEIARSKDGKTISLRLDPPSLGSVKIDLTLKDGQLHARFVAESAQVNALLRDQSHELQQILRRAGVEAERVTVSVAGETPIDLNQSFQSFDQKGTQQFEEFSRVNAGLSAGIEVSAEAATAVTATAQPADHWVA